MDRGWYANVHRLTIGEHDIRTACRRSCKICNHAALAGPHRHAGHSRTPTCAILWPLFCAARTQRCPHNGADKCADSQNPWSKCAVPAHMATCNRRDTRAYIDTVTMPPTPGTIPRCQPYPCRFSPVPMCISAPTHAIAPPQAKGAQKKDRSNIAAGKIPPTTQRALSILARR